MARSVVQSKAFDNGLIAARRITWWSTRAAAGAHLAPESRGAPCLRIGGRALLVAAVDRETHRLGAPSSDTDASTLAELAHIERPTRSRSWSFTTLVTIDNYLAAEKLAPVVSLITVPDMTRAERAVP